MPDNVVVGFFGPYLPFLSGKTVYLLGRVALPAMTNVIEVKAIEWVHDCVNMIRHYSVVAKSVSFSIEAIQSISYDSCQVLFTQEAGTAAGM